MKYVIDSSAAFKWVVSEVYSDKAKRLRSDVLSSVHELLAPVIFPGEVGNSLTHAERQGRITIGEAIRLWSDVMTTSPALVASLPIVYRAIEISSRTRVGVFDCLYVALAEREGCEFITADDRLVRNLQGRFPFLVTLASLP